MKPVLIYSAPKWRDELDRCPGSRQRTPRIVVRGRVAYIDFQPIGYRLVETRGGWRLGWQLPRQPLGKTFEFITKAGSYQQAADALSRVLSRHARPVYPDVALRGGQAGGKAA